VLRRLFYSLVNGTHVHLANAAILMQDRQCMFKRDIQARSRNHCSRGKAISILFSECVSLALVIHRAKCIHRIILSSILIIMMVWIIKYCHMLPVRLNHIFPRYLISDTIFGKKLLNIKFVL